MIRGSCFCGGIAFEVEELVFMRHCHCSYCRKETGGAFGTMAVARPEKFRFVKGAELVQFYDYVPGRRESGLTPEDAASMFPDISRRAFCRLCGSRAPLELKFRDGHIIAIYAGLFDDDPVVRPMLHMFVGSKAPWWEIKDSLPQYEEWVPGFEPPGARQK